MTSPSKGSTDGKKDAVTKNVNKTIAPEVKPAAKPKTHLEEDDEFEDFPAEGKERRKE